MSKPRPKLSKQAPAAEPSADRRLEWRASLLLALASTAMCWLLFDPFLAWPLAFVCLVPWAVMTVAARTTHMAAVAGYLFGFGFYVVNTRWLWPVIGPGWPGFRDGGILAWITALAMSGYFAVYFPISAWFIRHLAWRRRVPLWLSVPLVWVGSEYLRGVVITGFPWFFLAHSQYRQLWLIQIADVVGAYGVSFLIALVNGAVADVIVRRGLGFHLPSMRLGGWRTGPIVAGACLAVAAAYGVYRLKQFSPEPGPRVAIIQTNFPQSVDPSVNTGSGAVIERNLRMIDENVPAGSADVIVLSETSILWPINDEFLEASPQFIADNPDSPFRTLEDAERAQAAFKAARERIAERAAQSKADILTGVAAWVFLNPADRVRSRRLNSVMMVDASTGQLASQRYDKMHLVLFGESVPFRYGRFHWLYEWLNSITPWGRPQPCETCKATGTVVRQGLAQTCPTCLGQKQTVMHYSLTPGADFTKFPIKGGTRGQYLAGTPICYEDVVPGVCRGFVRPRDGRKGADFLVNLSNDGWFFHTPERRQHLGICVFRAVENRVGVARCVNTGGSAIIDSSGAIRAAAPDDAEFVLTGSLSADPRISVYSRLGDWPGGGCALLWLVWFVDAVRLGRRERRRRRAISQGGPGPATADKR